MLEKANRGVDYLAFLAPGVAQRVTFSVDFQVGIGVSGIISTSLRMVEGFRFHFSLIPTLSIERKGDNRADQQQ